MLEKITVAIRRSMGSFFYVGFVPGAPASYTALLVAVHLFNNKGAATFWYSSRMLIPFFSLYGICLLASIWIATDTKKVFGQSTPKALVLPHIFGQLVVFILLPINLGMLVMGFALYRFFDIVKPWPLYYIAELNGGFGLVLTPVFAGLYSSLTLHGLVWVYYEILSYLA